jgi:uncharacterized lipoprotein YajG
MKSSSILALLAGAILLAACAQEPARKLPVKETASPGQSSAPTAGAGSAAKDTRTQ